MGVFALPLDRSQARGARMSRQAPHREEEVHCQAGASRLGSVRAPFGPQGRDQAPCSSVSVLGGLLDHSGLGCNEPGGQRSSDAATGTQCARGRASGARQHTLLRWARPKSREAVRQRSSPNSIAQELPPAKKLRARMEGPQPTIRDFFAQQGQALHSGAGKRPCPFADGKPSRHLVADTAKRPKA